MRRNVIVAAIAAGIATLVASQCLFVVQETEQVVVAQFGKPVGQAIVEPGLKTKLPFVQVVNRFDRRFCEWDGERNQLPTRDKRFIFVDTYARWRISDPLKFFQRLRDERGAQSRLDDILDGETRNVIARHDLIEVVRTSVRDFAVDDEESGGLASDPGDEGRESGDFKVAAGRQELAAEVLGAAQGRTADLGIEILDFQFKRINYVEAVQAEVYSRMISERQRIAEQFRSQGIGEAARINGEKEWELARITSEAFRKTEETRGKADAEAARIYALAYNEDPEFYAFLKSMETYRATVDDQTTPLIGTDSELLQYLEQARPRTSPGRVPHLHLHLRRDAARPGRGISNLNPVHWTAGAPVRAPTPRPAPKHSATPDPVALALARGADLEVCSASAGRKSGEGTLGNKRIVDQCMVDRGWSP